MAIAGSVISCSLSNAIADTLWPPPPFGEGDHVTIREGIQKAQTYHCSRCSENESYPCDFRYELYSGEVAQIESHEGLRYWLDQTAIPRCSYCRIIHAVKGAAWVDCNTLVEVRMLEE